MDYDSSSISFTERYYRSTCQSALNQITQDGSTAGSTNSFQDLSQSGTVTQSSSDINQTYTNSESFSALTGFTPGANSYIDARSQERRAVYANFGALGLGQTLYRREDDQTSRSPLQSIYAGTTISESHASDTSGATNQTSSTVAVGTDQIATSAGAYTSQQTRAETQYAGTSTTTGSTSVSGSTAITAISTKVLSTSTTTTQTQATVLYSNSSGTENQGFSFSASYSSASVVTVNTIQTASSSVTITTARPANFADIQAFSLTSTFVLASVTETQRADYSYPGLQTSISSSGSGSATSSYSTSRGVGLVSSAVITTTRSGNYADTATRTAISTRETWRIKYGPIQRELIGTIGHLDRAIAYALSSDFEDELQDSPELSQAHFAEFEDLDSFTQSLVTYLPQVVSYTQATVSDTASSAFVVPSYSTMTAGVTVQTNLTITLVSVRENEYGSSLTQSRTDNTVATSTVTSTLSLFATRTMSSSQAAQVTIGTRAVSSRTATCISQTDSTIPDIANPAFPATTITFAQTYTQTTTCSGVSLAVVVPTSQSYAATFEQQFRVGVLANAPGAASFISPAPARGFAVSRSATLATQMAISGLGPLDGVPSPIPWRATHISPNDYSGGWMPEETGSAYIWDQGTDTWTITELRRGVSFSLSGSHGSSSTSVTGILSGIGTARSGYEQCVSSSTNDLPVAYLAGGFFGSSTGIVSATLAAGGWILRDTSTTSTLAELDFTTTADGQLAISARPVAVVSVVDSHFIPRPYYVE